MARDETFLDTMAVPKTNEVVLDQVKSQLSLEAKSIKLRLSPFSHIMRSVTGKRQ